MRLCGFDVGLDQPLFLIAGPCVVESRQLQIDVAGQLKEICAALRIPFIFKSSYDKANRSSGTSYRGPGKAEGLRILAEARFATDIASATNGVKVSVAEYHAHRIALGVPEGGLDWDFGDAYPHEANFDLLKGVSFIKGCYVGQEIVARMQHKTVIRKRVVPVTGARDLADDRPEITANGVAIGKLGSVAGNAGLAMLRLDRAAEFTDKGVALMAGSVPVTLASMPWLPAAEPNAPPSA